jgi:hypothetical protein
MPALGAEVCAIAAEPSAPLKIRAAVKVVIAGFMTVLLPIGGLGRGEAWTSSDCAGSPLLRFVRRARQSIRLLPLVTTWRVAAAIPVAVEKLADSVQRDWRVPDWAEMPFSH